MVVPVANVIVLAVLALMSMVPMLYEALTVIVAPEFKPVAWKMQVSCARGKLLTATAPPPDKAHPVPDQLPPPARFQNLFAAAVNVMPLFPLQSPNRGPDAGAAAPAMVMSLKSTSVKLTLAHVKVTEVPIVEERKKFRIVAFVPAATVKMPLIV